MTLLLLLAEALAGDVVTGRYVSDQDPDVVEAQIAAAIDRAVASASYVYRLIARPILAEQATSCPAYTTQLDGDVFDVTCDGKLPFRWTLGTSAPHERGGYDLYVKSSRDDDVVIIDFLRGERGGKRYTYTFAPEGLTVLYEIYSPYLGESVKWTATFVRE